MNTAIQKKLSVYVLYEGIIHRKKKSFVISVELQRPYTRLSSTRVYHVAGLYRHYVDTTGDVQVDERRFAVDEENRSGQRSPAGPATSPSPRIHARPTPKVLTLSPCGLRPFWRPGPRSNTTDWCKRRAGQPRERNSWTARVRRPGGKSDRDNGRRRTYVTIIVFERLNVGRIVDSAHGERQPNTVRRAERNGNDDTKAC